MPATCDTNTSLIRTLVTISQVYALPDHGDLLAGAGFEALRDQVRELELTRGDTTDALQPFRLKLSGHSVSLDNPPSEDLADSYANLAGALCLGLDFVEKYRPEKHSRAGEDLEWAMIRAVVQAHNTATGLRPALSSSQQTWKPSERVGDFMVLRVPRFVENGGAPWRQQYEALTSEHPLAGVILDLRGHGGGSLLEAKHFLDWFLPEGPIGGARATDGQLDLAQSETREDDLAIPLAVLIDEHTASGAEWIAETLKLRGRARLFGRKTAGSALIALPVVGAHNQQILLVAGELVNASNESLHGRGVVPNVGIGDPSFESCLTQATRTGDDVLDVAIASLGESITPSTHPACREIAAKTSP